MNPLRVARLLPHAIARAAERRSASPPELREEAEALLKWCEEHALITAIRALPSRAVLLADDPFYPALLRQVLIRGRGRLRPLDNALADPSSLARKSEIYVLATRPHRDIVRRLAHAAPGARVRSVFNDWLPDLVATTGMFPLDREVLDTADATPAPETRYAIFALPRSGSYYLCELLYRAGLGVPKEHLRQSTAQLAGRADGFLPAAFFDRLARVASRNGYFGTKVIAHYLVDVASDRFGRIHQLRRAIGRFAIRPIYLERRDLALQAVSTVVAVRRHSWRVVDPLEIEDLRPPPYDYDQIFGFYELFRTHKGHLERFLGELPGHHHIFYEDLDDDPLATFNGVLDFLGAPRVDRLPEVETLKVRNDHVLDYADRFRADLDRRGER